jgi:molybdopterin converting factor small subunit
VTGSKVEARVRFVGAVHHIVRESDICLALPDEATLGALLELLAGRYGEEFRKLTLRQGTALNGSVRIFVDNEHVRDLSRCLAPPGKSTAEVTVIVLSPVSGG